MAPDSASALMAFREARQGKSLTAEQAELLKSEGLIKRPEAC
jgi:hypothetical protein